MQTTETETTTTTATIADLIERRRIERAEQEQQREQERAEQSAAAEEEARESFTNYTARYISQELWDTLAPIITYDDNNGYRAREADRCAAVFTINGGEWRLTTYQRDSWERSYDREWTLHGPAGYKLQLGDTYPTRSLDAPILDAIEAFPAWLETRIEERSRQEAAERQRRMQGENGPSTPRYTRIHGTSTDDRSGAVLAPGRMLTVRVRQARGTLWDVAGTLLDVSNRWLLLDVAGGKGQRLIPFHRIGEIIPGLPVIFEESDDDSAEDDSAKD